MIMREFKFRAWNGMEMVYDIAVGKFGNFYINPNNNGLDRNDSASLTPCNTKYPDTVPIMQYTGLKDNNDAEIYEGDIVELDGMYFEVAFTDGAFEIWYNGFDFQGNLHRINSVCNIVGNIYQNKELLSKTKD